MKTLIYTMAYGDQAWRHAQLMVSSLRKFGNYQQDIRVYTDRKDSIDYADTIINEEVPKLPHFHLGKAFIGQTLDTYRYNRVMFLDSDILTIGDIWPMFEHHLTNQSFALCCPIECLIDEGYKHWYSIDSLTPYSKGEHGYNAGTILGAADKWNEFCSTWYALNIQHMELLKSGVDQPALNHLFREKMMMINPFPRDWVHFLTDQSLGVTKDTKMIHPKNPLKFWVMRCIYNLLESR